MNGNTTLKGEEVLFNKLNDLLVVTSEKGDYINW